MLWIKCTYTVSHKHRPNKRKRNKGRSNLLWKKLFKDVRVPSYHMSVLMLSYLPCLTLQLKLLLSCFGLSALYCMYLSTPDPARQPGSTPLLYSVQSAFPYMVNANCMAVQLLQKTPLFLYRYDWSMPLLVQYREGGGVGRV